MISSSYSRRLAGVSGMTVIVLAARHAIEVARARRHRLERVLERRVAQVDGQGLIAELRIEDDVDAGEVADRRQDVARAGAAKDQRIGEGDAARQLEADGDEVAGAVDQRFETRLALGRHFDLRRAAARGFRAAPVDVAVGRVELGRHLELDQRLFELARARQPPPAGEVVGRARSFARCRNCFAALSLGRSRTARSYSATARSKSSACSATFAGAERARASRTRTPSDRRERDERRTRDEAPAQARRGAGSAALNNFGSAWNGEGELRVGDADVLLQVGEGEGRRAALAVARDSMRSASDARSTTRVSES